MLNNKGFTLMELLAAFVVIAIISFVVTKYVSGTLSVGKEEAYQLMKDNIISSSYDYLEECSAGLLECGLVWQDNATTFYANSLKDMGYFTDLYSPIDNKDLGGCLKINVVRYNGVYDISLIDECY